MPDLTEDYLALRRDVGAVRLPRDVVQVIGPDAATFLHGQLSQDIVAMELAESRMAWLLQPDGKVVALLRVSRTGHEAFLLDTDPGWGERVTARLSRFKLRVRCDIDVLAWHCLALRGPRAHEVDVAGAGIVVPADWPGLPGVDVLAETEPAVPDGVRLCDPDAYEAVRIEAGVPVMGRELDERTIPAEAGKGLVDRAVSFTKGCYTGYELVERIDSRGGHVPRRLLGVVVGSNVIPPVGATLQAGEGKDAGTVTSVGESLDRRAPVALAFVRRGVEPGAEVTVAWDGGEAPARVEALPLVS